MSNLPERAGSGAVEHPTLPYLALAGGVLATSFSGIMTRGSEAPAITVAFWRLFLTMLLLAVPLLLRQRGALARISRRDWLLSVISGVALAAHFYFWNTSLFLTSVAASTVLVDMHPFIVLLGGYFLFGERIRPWGVAGAVVAVLGAVVIGVGDARGGGTDALRGDIFALVGALTVAVYFLIGRSVRQRVELLPYTVTVYGVASTVLVSTALLTATPVTGYPARTWWLFVGLAVIPTVFGHTVFSWVLRYVRAGVVSLSILGEPVGAGILAWFIFDQRPGALTYLGAVLILAGIGIFVSNVRDAR